MSTLLKFPLTLDGDNTSERHFVLFQSRSNASRQPDRPLHEIAMHMPASALRTQYSSNYREMEGILADVSQEAYKQMEALRVPGAKVTSVLNDVITSENVIALAENELSRSLKKADITKRILSGAGVAINPKINLMYDGPGGLRNHNFNFILNPKSVEESNAIKEIIKSFKVAMLPGYLDTNSFFSIPYTFDITFSHTGSSSSDGAPFKIKQSVLTNMTVDYAGGNIPLFFEDNNEPVSVMLELSFKETRVITRDDAEQGY